MTAAKAAAIFAAVIALLAIPVAQADAWLAPGDLGLRHDIELLADAGILRGPVSTWPMSWPDIARDVLSRSGELPRDAATLAALTRVQRLARAASAQGFAGLGARVSGAYRPEKLRTFADTPREEGEATLRASYLGDHLALNAQVTYASGNDQSLRADGSYLGVNIGNFMISAGLMERWWGPGWDGNLILSNNARPIPTFTIERNYTDPFRSKLLSWIGPWRASIALGEAETHDVPVPRVKFFAARVNFKPRPWLEFGLTRTAQWCGGARTCDFDTFKDLLLGRDNRPDSQSPDESQEPGNQMAGYDARLRSPWRRLPLVLYTQWIGEDEANGLPSKFLGQFGAEWWGSTALGSARVHLEYADTTCTFTRQEPQFGCAYRNSIYPQGYAYRGRIIGHSMDNDSRMWSLGAVLVTSGGDNINGLVRTADLNRDGGEHFISAAPMTLNDVEFSYSREFGFGRVMVGLGYESTRTAADSDQQVRGFLRWQQGF